MDKQTLVNFLAVVGGISLVYVFLRLLMSLSIVSLYITAKFAQTPIPFVELVMMRIRKVDIKGVVNSYITLTKNQINVKTIDLEIVDLAGMDLNKVTNGLLRAKELNIDMTIKHILDGRKKGIDVIDKLGLMN